MLTYHEEDAPQRMS